MVKLEMKKIQYDINGEAGKKLALSSGQIS